MRDPMTESPRRAERFDVGLPVHLAPGGAATVVNLSTTGVLVTSPHPAQVGQELTVSLPWNTQLLQLPGRVVRCALHYAGEGRTEWRDPEGYRVAIEFVDPDTHTATTLEALVQHAARHQHATRQPPVDGV